MSQTVANNRQAPWIHSTRLHVVMYASLLIATPFILLRNYMVQAISLASAYSLSVFGIELKATPVAGFVILAALIMIYRKYISGKALLAGAIIIALDALAQQLTDYYFGHNFYDLQQNWHYIAYGLYAYVVYRDLKPRDLPLHKIMLLTYFSALGLSALDETFQKYMSSRIFDICDIGKDVWGTYMGMILIYFTGGHSRALFKDWKKIRHKRLRNYYRHPFTLLLLLFVLSINFLSIGSVLTESAYGLLVIILTVIAFLLFFAVLHFSQFRPAKIIFPAILSLALVLQGFFFFRYRHENIVHTSYGLTVYKGFAIPFFDIMIFQDGSFRIVDKKHYFNRRDRQFFLRMKPDILLIASGADGLGGRGFSDPRHLFLFNTWNKKAVQVIIQKNAEACRTFNRLKRENKKVLFIIHNTC
jgi:VanZ family protein